MFLVKCQCVYLSIYVCMYASMSLPAMYVSMHIAVYGMYVYKCTCMYISICAIYECMGVCYVRVCMYVSSRYFAQMVKEMSHLV